MRLARVLGAIGRGLISAGVIVLMFVGYQLWGTGLQTSAAQGSLEDEFTQLLEQESPFEAREFDVTTNDEAQADDPDAADNGPVSVNATSAGFTSEELSLLYPEEGGSLARIVIPDINVDWITVEGTTVEALRAGPGHYRNTPNPGMAGNSAIAGHRTTYGAPFHRIDELKPGAEIKVQTVQGTFTYLVTSNVNSDGTEVGHFIVFPQDTWVLDQDARNLLTLTACHPKYSARQRIIVQAELVGEPAETIERDDADSFDPSGGLGVDEIISDEVAADDDPSVDAQGNPIESGAGIGAGASASASAPPIELNLAVSAEPTEVNGEQAELTAAESPFDEEGFGEGLNGDPTRIRPAAMWGLAGGAIWLAAWFVGMRLGLKWTVYAIAVVPFGFVLWATFVNIDQALPSY